MLPLEKIRPRYDRVVQYLTTQPHGEFYAVEYLFSLDIANMLVKRRDIKKVDSLRSGKIASSSNA
jgi:hypothetical protein